MTPAKKENPAIDSFEKAWTLDLKNRATNTPSRPQVDAPVVNKEPIEVMLYGYTTTRQWQAINTYEQICGDGVICEDYERKPPAELRRYPNTMSNAPRAHMTRPLTKAERAMAFRYAGGAHWVKVTFDSAEAAERAIEKSPIQVHQHWVYAQLYHGIAPQIDGAIPMTEAERVANRPLSKHAQTFGPSSAQQPGTSAPPTNPTSTSTSSATPQEGAQQQNFSSSTSSTASSGTATGADQSNFRQRNTQQAGQPMMKFFPDTPKYILRPASEALLPVPSFWERQLTWLAGMGLMPGEIIGNGMPMLENGQIDWVRASFYWRFFYWIDSICGTDYCGLKDD